ncbi:iron-containing redox enzyme family protein [Streptomyces sp. Z26]|uniref:iron-containing redox enzyme family protein n=1 Tax=Streptomyces TaxID=1883 RepID=UPI000EF1658C|nr:iron-containing redox enzyme family protein [Streptomyces sp. Z26]RLL69784.1 iron-containing redox enzyme family protein [Streptomyces sp. Z26]
MTAATALPAPALPEARGPVSAGVLAYLRGERTDLAGEPEAAAARAAPYGDDLQTALYVLYELHYHGFAQVPDALEWDPRALALRGVLERRYLDALRAATVPTDDVAGLLADLLVEPVVDPVADADPAGGGSGGGVSHHLRATGELWQLREYAAVRSLYHLKEADPHVWVVPRLRGRAKAAMVAVEFDEFGAGRAEDVHARLFADLMDDLDVDSRYGRHLDAAPAEALATVNLMSLFGLHRALRGALVGHFATVEVTSSPGARRLADAMRRAGAGPAAQRFYDEHVEADAVHEQIVRRDVVGGLLADEPSLAADVAFGIQATGVVEDRLGDVLLTAWRQGRTALRRPLTGDRAVRPET